MVESKEFRRWITDMLEVAEIFNPREIKILFREWEMRFVNLPEELKNNEDRCLKSALFLMKLLILKNKGHLQNYHGDIYASVVMFSRYFESRLKEKYDRS